MDEAAAMTPLHIQLLGGCRLTYAGQPVATVSQARVQSLLAWLLLHRQTPQARGHLAFTFWPDFSEAQARNNLRQMLHQLRHALPGGVEFLRTDANSVQWLPEGPYHLDVADFEALADHAAQAAGADDQEGTLHSLQAALDLYRGELLPSCYDDWIAPERERLQQLAGKVARQLVHLRESRREYPAASEAARRLLRLDVLDEGAYATLMRLHALNNDRAGALRVYHDCVAILQRELGAEPGDEVQAAYERLLQLGKGAGKAAQPASAPDAIPLVGRHQEWAQLRAAWQNSARGQPAVVLITGEAGIGKSRLAEELSTWVGRQGIAHARTRAYAAEGRLSYAPLTEWLRSPALAPALVRLDKVWLGEIARLLPELLIQHPDLPPPTALTEYWQRQRFFEALARGILAAKPPLLLLIDDLQWCDQETLEWLRFLLRFEAKARLLVVATARSDEINANPALVALLRALQGASQLYEYALRPLDAAEVTSLAEKVGTRALAVAEALHLFRESEGVPLFVVEMVRAGLHSAVEQPLHDIGLAPSILYTPTSALPPRIYTVIAGRLDQLSVTTRELVGVAATIGRAFTLAVLADAADKDEETVIDALEELWQRRIIRAQEANAYDFSHDKLRDVAYSQLSPIQQRRLHQRVAHTLHKIHAADQDAVCGQLAAHYEQAGLPEEAIEHYRRAAAVARRLLANEEAIGHLNRGLALLATLPVTIERQQQSLALLVALGTLLSAVKGNAAPQVREVYTQALELCRYVADRQQTFVVQQELRVCHGQCGELLIARDLAQANLALAEELANPEFLRYAHLGIAVVCHTQGELERARLHFEQAIEQSTAPSGDFDPLFFDNAMQGSLRHSALTLWLLGYPDQARQRMNAALELSSQNARSIRYAMTLYFAAMLHHYMGETDGVELRAEEIKSLASIHGYAYHQVSGPLFGAWVLARQGESKGVAQMRQLLEVRKANGHRLFLPYEMGLSAEAYLLEARSTEGLAVLKDALTIVTETGEYVWQAELLRLEAELLAIHGASTADVEVCYRHALELARQQKAKSLELRTASRLARLWQAAGRRSDAYQLLAPIYAWFSEGLATHDLQEARAILAELLSSHPSHRV